MPAESRRTYWFYVVGKRGPAAPTPSWNTQWCSSRTATGRTETESGTLRRVERASPCRLDQTEANLPCIAITRNSVLTYPPRHKTRSNFRGKHPVTPTMRNRLGITEHKLICVCFAPTRVEVWFMYHAAVTPAVCHSRGVGLHQTNEHQGTFRAGSFPPSDKFCVIVRRSGLTENTLRVQWLCSQASAYRVTRQG